MMKFVQKVAQLQDFSGFGERRGSMEEYFLD